MCVCHCNNESGYHGNSSLTYRVSLKKVMKNLDEYKRRWRAIENLTGLHVVSSSLNIKEEMVLIEYSNVTSQYNLKQEVNYEGMDSEVMYTSGESFEEFDETMSQYSMTSSMSHVSSTRSMDHPYQHQEQQRTKFRSIKHSASDSKLPSVASKLSISNMGTYQRIDEDLEVPNIKPPPRDGTTPNTKRRLFKKSKGNN